MIETTSTYALGTPASDSPAREISAKRYNFNVRGAAAYEQRTAGPEVKTVDFKTARGQSLEKLEDISNGESQFEYVLGYVMEEPTGPAEEETGYDFFDVLDVINPLQHLPLVSTLYRAISGDELKPAPQILGGALYGGAVGAIASTANVILEEETGRDLAGNAIGSLFGDDITNTNRPEIMIDRSRNLLNHEAGIFIDTNTLSEQKIGPGNEVAVMDLSAPESKETRSGKKNFANRDQLNTAQAIYNQRYNS